MLQRKTKLFLFLLLDLQNFLEKSWYHLVTKVTKLRKNPSRAIIENCKTKFEISENCQSSRCQTSLEGEERELLPLLCKASCWDGKSFRRKKSVVCSKFRKGGVFPINSLADDKNENLRSERWNKSKNKTRMLKEIIIFFALLEACQSENIFFQFPVCIMHLFLHILTTRKSREFRSHQWLICSRREHLIFQTFAPFPSLCQNCTKISLKEPTHPRRSRRTHISDVTKYGCILDVWVGIPEPSLSVLKEEKPSITILSP